MAINERQSSGPAMIREVVGKVGMMQWEEEERCHVSLVRERVHQATISASIDKQKMDIVKVCAQDPGPGSLDNQAEGCTAVDIRDRKALSEDCGAEHRPCAWDWKRSPCGFETVLGDHRWPTRKRQASWWKRQALLATKIGSDKGSVVGSDRERQSRSNQVGAD